jgi:hypothetical protein
VLVVSMSLSGYVPGQGPIDEAAAVDNCSSTDALVYGFSFGYVNEDKCTNNHVGDAVREVREAESAQDKVDLYAAAEAQKTHNQDFDAVYGNYVNDSESVAWMKAEKAIAEAHENGETKSQAKTAAREAISDYYTVKQINLINNWNTTITGWDYVLERSNQENFQSQSYDNQWEPHSESAQFVDYTGTSQVDVACSPTALSQKQKTLANGTSHTTLYLEVVDQNDYSVMDIQPAFDNDSDSEGSDQYYEAANQRFVCIDYAYIDTLMVDAPNSNYNDLTYHDLGEFIDRYRQLEARNNELQSESDAFVDATWQDLEDGNINSSDVISRNTQMFEYGSAAASGNGSYYDTIGATAAMGIETPQLEGTGTMTITDGGGTTHEGMLFGDPPNGSWTVGTTYDPSNISGPVIMATTDGEELELDRPFTVESATDKEGNERSVVETQRYNYRTSNTSDLNEKYDRLLGLSGELQERSESVDSNNGGGGGGGSSSGTLPDWLTATYFGIPLWAFAAVLLVALVLIGGDN